MSSEFSALDSFLYMDIEEPGGKPITDPEELTPALVAFLHDKVPEVYDYSAESLKALDRHFASEPPRESFTAEFLFQEFIPALGAYLGEVLKRELGGVWKRRKPVLTSAVRVKDREVKVFDEAFNAVYSGNRLAKFFRSVAKDSGK